jgi:DNA-binding MarR family transcriptional regulator
MSSASNKSLDFPVARGDSPVTAAKQSELMRLLPLLLVFWRINSWEDKNLPIPPTHAGKDLFIRIAISCLSQEAQSLKNLYWDSNYASSGMRKTLRQLEREGWLRREPLPEDMRCRILVATEKFKSLVVEYLQVLSDQTTEASSILRHVKPIKRLSTSTDSWKVLIVGNESDIHETAPLVSSDFSFDGRGVAFLHAYSGLEAMKLFDEHPDIAIALIDIAVATQDEGLRVARYIRDVLENAFVRLILRIEHSSVTPGQETIKEYDIDDCKVKAELSSNGFQMVLATNLRAYRDSTSINDMSRCAASLLDLSKKLQHAVSLTQLPQVLLDKLSELLNILALGDKQCSGVVVEWDGVTGMAVTGSGQYSRLVGQNLSGDASALKVYISPNLVVKVVRGRIALRISSTYSNKSFYLVFKINRTLSTRDLECLYLFREKASTRLDVLLLERHNEQMHDQAKALLARLASQYFVDFPEVIDFQRDVASWAGRMLVKPLDCSFDAIKNQAHMGEPR